MHVTRDVVFLGDCVPGSNHKDLVSEVLDERKEKKEGQTNEINVPLGIKPTPENKIEVQMEHEDDDNKLEDVRQKEADQNPAIREIGGKHGC